MTPAETFKDANDNIVITGWPMEYMDEVPTPFTRIWRKRIPLFS